MTSLWHVQAGDFEQWRSRVLRPNWEQVAAAAQCPRQRRARAGGVGS